jgi:uncharacterized phiE125 gp8 family phage protein
MVNITKVKDTYHVLLADVKAHLNIEASFTADDDLITQIIKDATGEAEDFIDGDIASTTTTVICYDFNHQWVSLDPTPVQSITSISYMDSAGDFQVITESDTTVQFGVQRTLIDLGSYYDTDQLKAIMVTGYANAASMPTAINRAILMRCADLYDVQRGSTMSSAFKETRAFEMALQVHKKINY